ncbi:MAG: hypothetical protein CL424_14855 [Acidimicrobiaceae bacterium]|nr:hypothetical protein [Acidimicrobiaceae bacterium]
MTTVPALRRRLTNAALTLGAVAAAATLAIVVSPGGGGRTIAAADTGLQAGGEFHEIDPVRIFDSRRPNLDVSPDAPTGAKPTGPDASVQFDVELLGTNGIGDLIDAGPDDVLAVVANVTVVSPTRAGHATIVPTGTTPGESSVVNFAPGQVVANSAILRPGQNGRVTVHLNTPSGVGSAHLLVDISGWFSTSTYAEGRGARVETIEPVRIYDSNVVLNGGNLRGAQKVTLPIRTAKSLETGRSIVPSGERIVGVIVNLTGVNMFPGSMQTHFSLVPNDFDEAVPGERPSTSNLNLFPGQTRANLAILPVGEDGNIQLFSLQGEVRAVVDVTGFLVERHDDTRGGRVIPLVAPFRALDTRLSDFEAQPLGPARAEPWSFEAFVDDVKVEGEEVGDQVGLFGNLTATGLGRQYTWAPVRTHLTVYPYPEDATENSADECKPPPEISNVNLGEGEAVPNMALLRYGDNPNVPSQLCVFNFAGNVDYLLDVYAVVLDDAPPAG